MSRIFRLPARVPALAASALRLAACLAACVFGALAIPAAAATPASIRTTAPTAAASGAYPAARAGQPLAAQAAALQRQLLAGTRRLAATRVQLASAMRRLQQARAQQASTWQALARASDGLNDFAAAAYRDPASSELGLLLQLTKDDPQDALTAAGYLARAGSYRSGVLADLRTAQAAAAAASAGAERARRQAVAIRQRVFGQVAQLQAKAVAAGAALSGPGTASRAGGRHPLPATDFASLAAAGYPNGLIPANALCKAGIKAVVLRCDAAAGFRRLAAAYARAFHQRICVTDSYRSYAQQVAVYRQRPSLAAVPGTSNHGWGLAVDLCGGLNVAGTAQDRWMHAHAGRFGWGHPDWAEPGGSRPEAWHWEFVGTASALAPAAG